MVLRRGRNKGKRAIEWGKECINCSNVAAARCLLKRPFSESDNVSQESLPKKNRTISHNGIKFFKFTETAKKRVIIIYKLFR